MNQLFLLLFVALFLLGLAIRAVYEQLKQARKIDEGNRSGLSPRHVVLTSQQTTVASGQLR